MGRPRRDPRRFMIAATCMLSMGCVWAPAHPPEIKLQRAASAAFSLLHSATAGGR